MDEAHDAKFAEMQKYIPFLESMEKRLENCGDEVTTKAAQLTKIKSLKGLLLSKKKKMKYDNLLKCEQVLIKLYSKVEKTDFQPTKSEILKDNLDTTNFGTESFDADELNRCREKLKSITKSVDAAVQERNTMSNNKTLPSVLREDEAKTTCSTKMTLDLYDSLSESDDTNTNIKAHRGPPPYPPNISKSFGMDNTFLNFGNSSSINYCRRSRSMEPVPSKTNSMQSSIRQPAATPRIYTRVLKSPEKRRSKSRSISPPISKQSEKQIPCARNDNVNLFFSNNKPLMSPLNVSPRSEVILAYPQGAGFYNRKSPMNELSRERRSKSTSKKDMNALPTKKYQDNCVSPRSNMYSSPRMDKPSLTLPVGGFYKRRSPKRLSREQRSRSTSQKDTSNDESVSPRLEEMYNTTRENLVTSPHFSGHYKRRSPKKLLEKKNSCSFNRETLRKEKSMSKSSEYQKNKNKFETSLEADNCETEREMELLRRIRSQIVSELNATNADMDIGKFISKKMLRKGKKKKNKEKVDVEEGEICDQYDELYDDLIIPERVADVREGDVLSGVLVSQQKNSQVNITSAESTAVNGSKRFDQLDLLPAKSRDTYTQLDIKIPKHNTVYKDKSEVSSNPVTPNFEKKDATKADELDDFFCSKLVEIRKKLEANKESKRRGKDDIKMNLLPEEEKKKKEINQLDKSEKKEVLDNREPSLLDIILNKSLSLETKRKSATKNVEKIEAKDKPPMVERASCGVSQSDILTALNSEIMMEKINLPEVTGSIATKSIKKDISDSTPVSSSAESDKKRRISLETYKEKIAPFVAPSVKDESDTSRSSHNEYEDHVNLISRALTAKEYERFHLILNSTINDNISDPEAKLSLRPLNQKSTNDTISRDQLIEDLFDTSKLLPEDLGPQSPDEELVFCDDKEYPVPMTIPPNPVSSLSSEALVPLLNDQIGGALDIDMRKASALPVSGNFNASYVKPGPASDVELFHQQFRSPQRNECRVPNSSENRNAPPVFPCNKDPRTKASVNNANINSNTQRPYIVGNNVPSKNITGHGFYNSNLPQPWDRNLYTDSVPASPINSFDQTEELTHFGVNNLNRIHYDQNSSNFIGNKIPIHDRGFFPNFPNKEMGLVSNTSQFADHARELNTKSSTCWRRVDDSEVHGRFSGQRESYDRTNFSQRSDGNSPIAENIGYKHDDAGTTRTTYSSDWNHSARRFGLANNPSRGIREQSNVSYNLDNERFGKKYTPGGMMSTMDTVPVNIRHTEVNAEFSGRAFGQFGYEYLQGPGTCGPGSLDRSLCVGRFENSSTLNSADIRTTVGRERTPGRDFIRGLSVGRSSNRESSVGRSLNREPSVGRVFDRQANIERTFNRETSVGRVLYREPIGPTFIREPSLGRPFVREQSVGRTFNREKSVERTFYRAQSVGKTLTREPSVGRTFIRDPSIGRTFTRESSVGGTFNREQSIGRNFKREPSISRVFNREPSVGRDFNREPSVGRNFKREPSVGRTFNREPSLGRSFHLEPSSTQSFKREPSIGRVLYREHSVGKNVNCELSLSRTINRESSVGRSLTREVSVGRTLNREPSLGRMFNREHSVGRTTNKSSSASQIKHTDDGRDQNSERSYQRGRSTSRNESNDLSRRERRSPSGRDTRSRRELYDQQKASFPKDKYSRDPRLARERRRESDKNKSRGCHTDYRTSRHSKSPKGFVYTKDNLAKGFSGHSGISNYKIPKIKREPILVPESTSVLIDTNNSVITSNEDIDKASLTLDLKQDVDMRVTLSSQGVVDLIISEDSNSHTSNDIIPIYPKECVSSLNDATSEPDKIKSHKVDTFVEKILEPSEEIILNHTDFESLSQSKDLLSVNNFLDITPELSNLDKHTDKTIKLRDQSALDRDNGPVSKNIANDQVHSSKEETEIINENNTTLNLAEEKRLTITIQENKNSGKMVTNRENREKILNTSDLLKTLPETTEKNCELKLLPNPKKRNNDIVQTNISSEKNLKELDVDRSMNEVAEDGNVNTNKNTTVTGESSFDNDDKNIVDISANAMTAEAESTHDVKSSEDVSNALPDSTIQFGNDTYEKTEASGEIPDSTNNVGSETKSSEGHLTAESSLHQTGSKKVETTAARVNDSCTPIDALGSILSILTDKSKIKEILSLLGDNSTTSEKIKRKLAKLTEIESDDDEEETSNIITNSPAQHSKLADSKATAQDLVPDTPPLKPEESVLKTNIDHVDLNLKNIESQPKSKQCAQELKPEQDTSKAVEIVTLEEATKENGSEEKNVITQPTKRKLTKKVTKSQGPKKNVSKKVFVKKRITRQSVAMKGNTVLNSPCNKKSTLVGKVSKAKPKKKRLDELQKLQVDIREMFISDDVLSATGIRNCRITKLTDTIDTAAMKKDTVPMKKDTVPSTSPLPLQKATKPKKKLKKNFVKNNENVTNTHNKVEKNRTPFVVIKEINPDVFKNAKKATFDPDERSSICDDKSLDKKNKMRQKPGPKSRTSNTPNVSNNITTLGQNEKDQDNTEGKASKISISATSSKKTNSIEKPVVLRPGPKSKKLLCLQNMLQQNQDTISVDEIQDIILGLRDNCNKTTQKYPEHPSSDSEDEALSTLAIRRMQDTDINLTSGNPIQIRQQHEPLSEIKLVDENYCFDSLNSKYDCKLCKYNGDKIVHHYKDCHPHDEILISRIRPALVKVAIQQSRTLDHESSFTGDTNNTYTRLQCLFCLENFCNVNLETFFWHIVTAHTGEYKYDCLLCTDDMAIEGECKQASLDIPQPPVHTAKYLTGYVCGSCSFTQVSEKNVKDHITAYHKKSDIEIHVINLSNVSITLEQGSETSKLSPITNMVKKNKSRCKQRVNSSNPVSKDDKVLLVDDVLSPAHHGCEQDLTKNNAVEAPTTMINEGLLTSNDVIKIKNEMSRVFNTSKIDSTSRTRTRKKVKKQLTSSTTTVADKSDDNMTIKIASIGIRTLPGGVLEYCCNVSKCLFRTTLLITFSSHLLNVHATDQWNGDCAVCKHNVKEAGGRYSHTEELKHLVHAHMDDLDPQSVETKNNDIKTVAPTFVSVQEEESTKLNNDDKSSENNLLENQTTTPRKYINVRPFSDLAESSANIFNTEISNIQRKSSSKEYMNTDTDCEAGIIVTREECQKARDTHVDMEAENYLHSIPQIREVVSLYSVESGSIGRTSPLANIASSWLEEDKSNENSTVHGIGDNTVPTSKPTAEVPVFVCHSLETPTAPEKEAENATVNVTTWKPPPNTDAVAHPVFAAKSPKVARKMMVAKKQVHPFKCGGRFCSFTTHDTSAFSAHLSAHTGMAPGVRCCVYCPFEASGELRALMQHVFSEHAHCQFACVYCPYVSTSSILVEMHRTGAHPEKAPAVLRLHAAHANVQTASSRGALPRNEAVLPYVCMQRLTCKFQCLTSAQFVSHLAEHKHTQFRCSKCLNSFPRTSHLIRHLRQHGLCLYQCTYCVFGADAELDLLKHIAKEHPMRRAQAYLRHVSSTNVESDRGGLPLVNMEKKFNGKIQICESKYTEDPIAEAEAADKLQFEYETKMATEFLTNQSKGKDTPTIIEMDTQQLPGDLVMEMPRISFVTSIANVNSSASITTVAQHPEIGKITTEISKGSVDLQESTTAVPDQKLSTTKLKKVEKIQKTTTQINDTSKHSSNMSNESIICLDSDGEDNSELNINNIDPIALDNVASETPLQGVEQNIKPQGVEKKIIEKSDSVHKSARSIITLSDDETHAHVTTSDIAISEASTSDILHNRGNVLSVSSEGLTKNKMIVDSTSLFRCSKCDMSTRAAYNFSMHITKCYSKTNNSISCYHCQTIVADSHNLIVHLIEHHSDLKLYKCALCQYIEWTASKFLNHMKSAHSANSEIPIDSESQIMIIGPKKRRKRGPKQGTKMGPKSKVKEIIKTKLAISDASDLPRTPIVNYSMYCVKCNFGTKVTSNMARHLQYHESQLPVASSEPVNPVPHLESNEMHFDKMTNLAASSNLGRVTEKTQLKEKPRPAPVRSHNLNTSNYPQCVQDHERYACGAIGCAYLSLNEDMLKCHWETLHAQDNNFKCPHCPAEQQLNNEKPLTWARIAAHLKMHDSRMYVCSQCPYYHYHKHYVERHVNDKHLITDCATLQCLREPPSLASSADEAAKGTPTMDLKPWCCGFCSFKTMLRADIIEHCNKVHNIRSQYKCGSCSFNHANEQNIRKHQSLFHAGSLALKLITVYFKANRPSTEDLDGSPSWWQQRKRSSMEEPGSSPKKMKLSESNAFKSTESGSLHGANHGVNLDLVKEEPLENMDVIQVCDESLTDTKAEQDPEIAPYTFVCPLCTTYKISDVEAMKSHLYEELNYRKWGCNVCSYKSFERDRLVKHIMVEHGVVQEPKSLPEDQRIEQWISTVISTQENHTKTSEKNKTIVYLMRILPGKDNTDNQTQNVTDKSSNNETTSDQKSKTKEGRKTKSIENLLKISAVDAEPMFKFPKVDDLSKNPVGKPRINHQTQSTENESRSLLKDCLEKSQKVDENQKKSDKNPMTGAYLGRTQAIVPAQSSTQELVAIFGSFGESKGYRFVCPKCHYGVDNRHGMRKHLETELDVHLYKCDLCHLKFNSVTIYVKHYSERHNGGIGPNKVSTTRILAQANEWMDGLIRTQGQSIAAYISTHGPDPAPDCQPANPVEGRKRRHSLITGSQSDDNDSSDEERLVIIEPSKPQAEPSKIDNVLLNQDLTDVSNDDQSSTKQSKIDSTSKARNYNCPHCYFVTRYSTCLVDHISRHFYDRPFKCGYCDFKHYRKQVKAHLKRVHPKEVPKVIKVQFPDTPLIVDLDKAKNSGQNVIKVCLICETSLLPQQISSHFNILHPGANKVLVFNGDTVYRCNDCALMLQTLDDMTKHFHSAHPRCRINYMLHRIGGGEPQSYLCNHCSNVFPHMIDLHYHHERTHTNLKIDFADLGPSKSTSDSEFECASTIETSEAMDVTISDPMLCVSEDTTNKVIRRVAKKSTTKLPPSVRKYAVARKSTTKLPFNIEPLIPFSVYGRTPDKNIGHLTTKMPFYGTLMPFTVQKLKDIINISPVVLVEDVSKKSK